METRKVLDRSRRGDVVDDLAHHTYSYMHLWLFADSRRGNRKIPWMWRKLEFIWKCFDFFFSLVFFQIFPINSPSSLHLLSLFYFQHYYKKFDSRTVEQLIRELTFWNAQSNNWWIYLAEALFWLKFAGIYLMLFILVRWFWNRYTITFRFKPMPCELYILDTVIRPLWFRSHWLPPISLAINIR